MYLEGFDEFVIVVVAIGNIQLASVHIISHNVDYEGENHSARWWRRHINSIIFNVKGKSFKFICSVPNQIISCDYSSFFANISNNIVDQYSYIDFDFYLKFI